MPSFDTISQWALANLYLVGAATGVALLVVLLILLLMMRRGRGADERSSSHGGEYAEANILGETLPAAPEMDLLTPLRTGSDDTAVDDHATGGPSFARALVDDAAEYIYPPPAPTPPPKSAGPSYVPPSRPLGNHARDIVQGLIRGQGDITGAELRRIELVLPEKILEAVTELEAGLQGRGKESQRARLAKIRQHAELLQPGGAESDAFEPHDESAITETQPYEPHETGLTIDSPDWLPTPPAKSTDQPLPEVEVAPLFTSMPEPVIGEAAAIGPTPEPAVEQRAAEDDDVLGLDEGERVDALRFLTPAELGRRFSATDDKTLKLSIIDALEEAAGPEAISVIQVCLDDPDSEVQLHALEAAERLLAQL